MEAAGETFTRFVLFFPGRTGSTYLVEALDSHPNVRAGKEWLPRPKHVRERSREELLEWGQVQTEWVRTFFATGCADRSKACSAVGFKTKLKDVGDPERMADALRELSVRILHMRRRNTVKLAVSLVNSERLREGTGEWNLYEESDRPPPAIVDPEVFQQRLTRIEGEQRQLSDYVASLDLPMLTIDYEDLLLREQATLERTCAFLGVEPRPMRGQARKATSDDLRQAVANFDELRAAYAGTPHEPMFDEILLGPQS